MLETVDPKGPCTHVVHIWAGTLLRSKYILYGYRTLWERGSGVRVYGLGV